MSILQMVLVGRWILLKIAPWCFLVLVGCAQDNEHFCAKYSFFYDQLSQQGNLPLEVIRQQLEADIEKHGRERDKMMLLVLDDKENRLVGVRAESPAQTCMRLKRWQRL